MEDWKSRFRGKSIWDLRGALTTLRRTGAARLKRVRRWRRWFVRGAIVGVIWAMLYAPQSGAETRAAVGQLLRPLAVIGGSLFSWLQHQQHVRQEQAAARRAPGPSGPFIEGQPPTPSGAEASGAGDASEAVERSLPRNR